MNNKNNNKEKLLKLVKSSIPLNNNVFMIFATNKKFCQEFLRVVLQDKKLVVIENDIQKYLPSAFNKNVCIDMLCKLSDLSIVNVEIQLLKEKEHAKRIFEYAAKIKNYIVEKGEKYKDLKDIIEIYLTKEDIFKKGSTVYEVEMNIVSDKKEEVGKWDAGLKVYYINTEGLTNKNINEYLKILTDRTTINNKYKITSEIKKSLYESGGTTMSKELMEILESERLEGVQEGLQQGREEGIQEGIQQGIQQGMQQGMQQGVQQGLQQGREEGRIEGRVEGIQQGMQQGKHEGKVTLLVDLYNNKIINVDIAAEKLNITKNAFLKLVNSKNKIVKNRKSRKTRNE